jgi:hypothetical protein
MRNNHFLIQSKLEAKLSTIDGVDKASVIYYPADNSRSILKAQQDIGASVMLTVNDKFDKKNTPASIATYVAYAIGNSTTDKIKIIDQHGRLLFGGEAQDPEAYTAETTLSYKQTVEKWYADKMLELATINGYYNAEIVPEIEVNMEKTSVMFTEYLAAEGLEQGVYDEYTKISSENTGVAGDIPGTDSNDETDYYIQTQGSGNSAYNEEHYKFKPSERVTQTVRNSPFIDHDKSRMALTFRKAIQVSEESLEEAGELENTTFDRYVETHQNNLTEVTDQDEIDALKQLFSDASGIAVNNISLRVYEETLYIPKPGETLIPNYTIPTKWREQLPNKYSCFLCCMEYIYNIQHSSPDFWNNNYINGTNKYYMSRGNYEGLYKSYFKQDYFHGVVPGTEEIILSLYDELEEKELTWLEREPGDDIQYDSLRQWCRERMKCYQIIEVPYLSDV